MLCSLRNAVPMAVATALSGCSGASSPFVGTWQYDKESLRELAHASAYDSMTAGGEDVLTPEESADLERWVNEQHDQWNKSLELLPSGRFVATSQIGEGRPEEITGSWTVRDGLVRFVEDDGEPMATGRLEQGRLVLELTDDEGVMAEMVMLAADERGR